LPGSEYLLSSIADIIAFRFEKEFDGVQDVFELQV
jgi:hypothetical protein